MILFMTQSKRRMIGGATLKLWPLFVLIVLIGAAVYLWTAPILQERRLQTSTLDQLQAASRREPNNARVFYYLGLHLQGLGQTEAAQNAYVRAVTLDPNGLAATIRDLHQRKTQAAIPTDRLISGCERASRTEPCDRGGAWIHRDSYPKSCFRACPVRPWFDLGVAREDR